MKNYIKKFNNPLYIDSLWAIIGNISLRGLGLLGSMFIARFLGSEVFGEYGAIKNTIVSVAIFSTFGLGYTATKFVADLSTNKPHLVKNFIKKSMIITLTVSVMISLVMFFSPNIIAIHILNAPHLTDLIMYASIWVVFNALTLLQIGVISGYGDYKSMAKVNTVVGVFTFVISVGFTWSYGLKGAVFSLILAQVFNFYLYYKLVNKHTDGVSLSSEESISYKEILVFTFPIALQEFVYSITSWLITILLIKYSTYSELGVYTASLQWAAVVLFIPSVLRNVILSNLSKEKDIHNRSLLIKNILKINALSTFLPILVIFIMSGFISSLYGDTFSELKAVLIIVLTSTIFISINSVYSQAYMSIGKNWIMFTFRLFRDLLILGLSLYLILDGSLGLEGALSVAWATLASNLLFMFLIGYFYHYKLT